MGLLPEAIVSGAEGKLTNSHLALAKTTLKTQTTHIQMPLERLLLGEESTSREFVDTHTHTHTKKQKHTHQKLKVNKHATFFYL